MNDIPEHIKLLIHEDLEKWKTHGAKIKKESPVTIDEALKKAEEHLKKHLRDKNGKNN